MPDMIKDFGTLNGYGPDDLPCEVLECWQQRHTLINKVINKGLTESYCPQCKIRYRIDSSD